MTSKQKSFYKRYYSQLIGAEIVGFKLVPDKYDEWNAWPTFTVRRDGKTFDIEISRDEEGNGAGFIFGLPALPEKRT